jgi:hypothetical protein
MQPSQLPLTQPSQLPLPHPQPVGASTPTTTVVCPKCNVHALVRNDDTHYAILPHELRPRAAKHACMARTDTLEDPKTYVEAMAQLDAAMSVMSAACIDSRAFNWLRIGVLSHASEPKRVGPMGSTGVWSVLIIISYIVVKICVKVLRIIRHIT